MNIDFHYGIVYIVSRMAGMSGDQAAVVAHACQYVDDATTDGPLRFAGQQSFDRFASAHAMLDYRNVMQARDERVWAPFHFLPSGEGHTVEERLVCRPNSKPAQLLVRHVLNAHKASASDNDLHRLGVCLHTYVDTWAHQGFSGIMSDRNHVLELMGDFHPTVGHWLTELAGYVEHAGEVVEAKAINYLSKVGHGAALHYPDLPWVTWRYRNGLDETIDRNNLPDFVAAADMACKAVQAFLANEDQFEGQPGLDATNKAALTNLMAQNTNHDGDKRLAVIAAALAQSGVGGLKEPLPPYIAKGEGSWKYLATGITADDDTLYDAVDRPEWSETFEGSDYRKVHDAIKQHRHFVTEDLLLSFGLRLA